MSDRTPRSDLAIYQTDDGRTHIQCRFEDETIWLTQVQIAELFQTSVPNINIHLKAIYAEGELVETATIKSCLIVRTEGARQVTRDVLHYSLPVILAVGYRVRSPAPELISERADADKPNMGLMTWKGGAVRKGDVTVAKNYLREVEISELNRLVVMFLDYAEDQARRRKQIFLSDWQVKLDESCDSMTARASRRRFRLSRVR